MWQSHFIGDFIGRLIRAGAEPGGIPSGLYKRHARYWGSVTILVRRKSAVADLKAGTSAMFGRAWLPRLYENLWMQRAQRQSRSVLY